VEGGFETASRFSARAFNARIADALENAGVRT
jgi:hypothetical protein